MPFERVDLNPLLTFWLLAGRPTIEGQRLVMHLPFGGDLHVVTDQANRKMVVRVVAPEPTAAPATPAPPPVTPVPMPAMSAPPEPYPSPSLSFPGRPGGQ